MTLSEIEQFYREQDERMGISDEDSDEDPLAATSIRNTPTSHTSQLQEKVAINGVGFSGLNPTADSAAHQQHTIPPPTNLVTCSEHTVLHRGTGEGSSVLKRKAREGGTDVDTIRESVEGPKRKHARNLQPLTIDVPIFPPTHHGVISPSESRESSYRSVPKSWVRMSKNTLSIADPVPQTKDDKQPEAAGEPMTTRRAKSVIHSGTNISISLDKRRLGMTNRKGRVEPQRIRRKTPKGANLVSNMSTEARDIIDLTLDFAPQLTSTQVAASPSRKARIHPEEKPRVSSHAAHLPSHHKVIKPTKLLEIEDAIRPSFTPGPLAEFPTSTPIEYPSKATGREETGVMYSSNITTPASSNTSVLTASALPSSPILDEPSASRSDARKRPSMQEARPKKDIKPGKGKGKEKPGLITPLEYAQRLLESLQAAGQKSNRKCPKYLKGKRIFYVGGDMQYAGERTRRRMDIIVRYGGSLQPTYDASTVTHIVTDAPEKTTLRALGLRKLDDIPSHIPTVRWGWVLSGKMAKRTDDKAQEGEVDFEMDDVCMHAAFLARFEAGAVQYGKAKKDNRKAKPEALASMADASGETSRISEFTQEPRDQHLDFSPIDTPSKSSIITSSPAMIGDCKDPLAEFYAIAKAEAENLWPTYGEEHSDDELSDGEGLTPSSHRAPAATSKRGFTCDIKEAQGKRYCANQDVVDKLQELMELHKAKPSEEDRWRAFSYGKCLKRLRNYPKRITSYAEARSIRGVGDKTALKIMEILQTGELRRIGYEKTEDVEATEIFQGIYGVGQLTAFKWYASGCRTLEDIKARKGGIKLSTVHEIGVRFYDDINDRMPRAEAEAIFQCIKPLALAIDPKLFIDIMGSFRRGKADCGDIDILITRPVDDGKSHLGVLRTLLRRLHEIELLTEDLSLPEDWDDLECTYRGLCRLPHQGKRRRRIDILTVPWHSRGAALLYYTGDEIFNRAMRYKAGTMGYSLNQRGLYGGVVRDPRDRRKKLNAGTIVASETEEEIFRILGVPWQEPHERVRG